MRDLVEGEAHVGVMEGGADEVAAVRGHVRVGFAEDLLLGVGLVWFGLVGFGLREEGERETEGGGKEKDARFVRS